MKLKAVPILILACFAVAGIAVGSNETVESASKTAEANESFTHIFIQEGDNGSFTKDESGNYTLIINRVVPYTVYFSDRPARDAGFVEMEKFIDGFDWNPANPPNAAVMLSNETTDRDIIVVELTMPTYDKANQRLTYAAKLIDNYVSESPWHNDLVIRGDYAIPEEFDKVVVAIDDCPCVHASGCSSGCRGGCWDWSSFSCQPCGGCCSSYYSCNDPLK